MKWILVVTALFYVVPKANAASYYVSSANGNDALTAVDAQNPTTPWQTLPKAVSVLQAGDSLFLQRGSVFQGPLVLKGKKNITVTAYDDASNPLPVITMVQQPSSCANNGNQMICTLPSSSVVSQVYVNQILAPRARFPNWMGDSMMGTHRAEYLLINKVFSKSQLNITTTSTQNWVGAVARVRSTEWTYETRTIVNQTGNTLTLSSDLNYLPNVNDALSITDHIAALDAPNEWFQNGTTLIIQAALTSDIQVIYANTQPAIQLDSANFVTLQNIQVSKVGTIGISMNNAGNVTLDSLQVNYAERDGISGFNLKGILIQNCQISNCKARGAYVGGVGNQILNNSFTDIGLIAGEGVSGDQNLLGLISMGSGSLVAYNRFERIGYNGLQLAGSFHVASRNYFNNVMLVLADGAAIYQVLSGSNNNIIEYNTISNSVGNSASSANYPNKHGSGIYNDELSSNSTIRYNSISDMNAYGIFLHSSANNIVIGNDVRDSRMSNIFLAEASYPYPTLFNNVFSGNYLVQDSNGDQIRRPSKASTAGAAAVFDNNTYCNNAADLTIMESNAIQQCVGAAVSPQ